MSRMPGRPTQERRLDMERMTRIGLALYGPVVEPYDPEPYRAPEPDYIWNELTYRYHWRVGKVTRDGKKIKKGSFHPVPKLTLERKLYEQRLKKRRDDNAVKQQGHRLKLES